MMALIFGIVAILAIIRAISLRRDIDRAHRSDQALRKQRDLAYEFLRQSENYSTTLEKELFQVRGIFNLAPGERTVQGVRRKLGGKPS